MRKLLLLFAALILWKCEKKERKNSSQMTLSPKAITNVEEKPGEPTTLKKEVPVLCYHNFTEATNTIITLSRERFEEHIRSLVDSGYHGILPDQLYDYLTAEATLPSKPVIISFDDTRLAQYTIAAPILERYGFRGVFFIMTICVNKPNYMSSVMINDLASRGHIIGVHTYDHPSVSDIKAGEWTLQLKEPKIFVENAIHNDVNYFAYPYGQWTKEGIKQLKSNGYKAAFQLEKKQSSTDPLYTIRRLMVQGNWNAKKLQEKIAETFTVEN